MAKYGVVVRRDFFCTTGDPMTPKTLIRQAVAAALRKHGIDDLAIDADVAEAVVKVLEKPQEQSEETDNKVSRDESKLFISEFCTATRLVEPNPKTVPERKAAGARWYQPVRRMISRANGKSIETMKRTVSRMDKDQLTISAPQSIENVFEDEYRKIKTVNEVPPSEIEDLRLRLQEHKRATTNTR